MPDENKTIFVPKVNCYNLNIAFKELPEEVKGVPLELEGAVSQQTQHFKSAYKTARFDFYKEDGFGEGKDSVWGRPAAGKKQRNQILHILACIGNSVEIEYDIKENNIAYTFRVTLQSGDILFTD